MADETVQSVLSRKLTSRVSKDHREFMLTIVAELLCLTQQDL